MSTDSFKVKRSLNIEPVASPSMTQDGDIAVDSSTNRVKVRTNSTTDNVVTDSGTQTLTNKTLTAPTIDVAILDGQGSTPANPSAGYYKMFVDDTTSRLNLLDSAGVVTTVGSGSGGGINYIDNPDAEGATTGWATYADAAASTPVDGTGGSPSATWTRSTSSPLRGIASFVLSKGASNRQGDGASFDFSIDTADQGKPQTISFDYYVSSGTYATGDVTVYIYDVTNATLIQPSGYQIVSQTVQASHLGCTFQAASNSTSYRLILHIASTSAVAYDLKFDNFYVGPQQRSYGPAITDWVSWTPTGSWNTNVTYTGKKRRVGDTMEIEVDVGLTGAPNATTLEINNPPECVLDSTKVAGTNGREPLGIVMILDSSASASIGGYVVAATTTTVSLNNILTGNASTSSMSQTNATTPITFATSDSVRAIYRLPCVGWASNTLVSSSASTRVVAARFFKSAQSVASGSDVLIQADTTSYDTHGAVTTGASAKFTAPVPGYYRLHGFGQVDATSAFNGTTEVFSIATYVNGGTNRTVASMVPPSATVSPILPYTDVRYLNAGDYVDLRVQQTSGSNHNITAVMQVEQIQGPAQIAASEVISARVYLAANQSSVNPNNTAVKVTYDTASFDTHGAWASNKFTVPAPGKYQIDGSIWLNGTNVLANVYAAYIYKNGSAAATGTVDTAAVGVQKALTFAATLNLVAGDYIEIFLFGVGNNSASTLTINGGATASAVNITRVGGI